MGSDDESCLIGGVEKREIVVVDYDPSWPVQYQRHAGVISDALGATLLRIEHVGSTAVPGLAAKPIIDLLAVVTNSADEAVYVPKLEAVGFHLRVREPSRGLLTPSVISFHRADMAVRHGCSRSDPRE